MRLKLIGLFLLLVLILGVIYRINVLGLRTHQFAYSKMPVSTIRFQTNVYGACTSQIEKNQWLINGLSYEAIRLYEENQGKLLVIRKIKIRPLSMPDNGLVGLYVYRSVKSGKSPRIPLAYFWKQGRVGKYELDFTGGGLEGLLVYTKPATIRLEAGLLTRPEHYCVGNPYIVKGEIEYSIIDAAEAYRMLREGKLATWTAEYGSASGDSVFNLSEWYRPVGMKFYLKGGEFLQVGGKCRYRILSGQMYADEPVASFQLDPIAGNVCGGFVAFKDGVSVNSKSLLFLDVGSITGQFFFGMIWGNFVQE